MFYCIVLGYSSVFLLNREYSNSQIGVILAVGFLASVILQQYIAALADKARHLSLPVITALCVLCLGLCSTCLMLSSSKSAFLTIVFILACVLEMLIQPLVNSLNFYLQKLPVSMNFGAARSVGSLMYSAASFLLGIAIERKNPNILPFCGVVVCVYVTLLLLLMAKDYKENIAVLSNEAAADTERIDFASFFYRYRRFFVFLAGGLGLFFGHTLINNYLYQIAVHAGGNSQDLGNLQAFSALLELPAMIFFARLHQRFGCRRLLQLSAVFFVIKILFALIAQNILMLYVSMLFQSVSFAIFIPGSVHFVNEVMQEKDAIKGQAFVTGMITIANLLSSLLGGAMLDYSSVFIMLSVGAAVTGISAAVTILSLK